MRRRTKALWVFPFAMLLLGSGECGDRSPTPIIFENASDTTVVIYVKEGTASERRTGIQLAPHDSERVFTAPSQGIGPCTKRTLIARARENGSEIERAEAPLCSGDTWVIGD